MGKRAQAGRAQASALYFFFYYTGSSVVGATGGFAWSGLRWPGRGGDAERAGSIGAGRGVAAAAHTARGGGVGACGERHSDRLTRYTGGSERGTMNYRMAA